LSPVNQYKEFEANFAEKMRKKMVSLWKAVKKSLIKLLRLGRQRFTVMLIPHSEKKIFNFQINTFAIIFFTVLLTALITSFFFLTTHFTGSSTLITEKEKNLENAEASLETIREEVNDALKTMQNFYGTLVETMGALGMSLENDVETELNTGDLLSISNLEEVEDGELQELKEIERFVELVKSSIRPLTEVGENYQFQQKILSDIPNLWPVIYGLGRVSLEWGPYIHPISDRWYFHKGIDITYALGTPLVASANGKVREVGYDRIGGFGNYVWIDHAYGIKTRYSHLQRIDVKEGDIVFQGDQIGTMGSTGTSTGTHLDFQIWIGSQLVDPSIFLHISNSYDRWFGNGRGR
jgi:murein DD-endopeptidase MepM/ murein hydrolase activator NlpD